MDGQFLGQILPVAFNYAPKTWATCSAQIMAINTNQALFSLLGTTYGGNGVNTFALPDLRGRVAIHQGQGPGLSNYTLGEMAGAQTTTMLASNLPLHTHLFMVSTATPDVAAPNSAAICAGGTIGGGTSFQYGASAGTTMNPGTIAPSGSNLPFSIMQPYNVLQYCIALQGIFPSRN